jgi:peptidoglycan hydrolase-like protein with peptidoglycan-binding domain
LREGVGPLDIPQGVTVVRGLPRDITRTITDTVLQLGVNIIDAVRSNDATSVSGFRPETLVLQPARRGAENPRPYIVDRVAETLLWSQTQSQDTVTAYRNYIGRYPRGVFVQDARDAIQAIQSEPNRAARMTEERLQLSRQQRRAIQRNLSLLDHNTRGIDGVFGTATRAAIKKWQGANSFRQSGYLGTVQIGRIKTQADRRSTELEAEAARERQAQLRRDRAFWQDTGASGREGGLRQYLERFPDGIRADEARDALKRIEDNKLGQAVQQDRNAWRAVRTRNTLDAYRVYLRDYPKGAFRAEAQARVQAITADRNAEPSRDRAAAAEAALGLNAITMRLVQNQLRQLGYNVGRVDGRFDNATRRAIREFQRSRNLDVTGYLDQRALLLLLIQK